MFQDGALPCFKLVVISSVLKIKETAFGENVINITRCLFHSLKHQGSVVVLEM